MHSSFLSVLLGSILSIEAISAYSIPRADTRSLQARKDPVSILLEIAPSSKSCDSAAQYASECVTANAAAQPILKGFSKYQINTPGETAALLAWMALESGEFKYSIHHFGAVNPGQGTRCMMGPNFVREYATDLKQSVDGKAPEAILAGVNDDLELSFGAAAWFYQKHCSDAIKQAVKAGTLDGFKQFTTGCVSTTITDERVQYWNAAAKALSMTS